MTRAESTDAELLARYQSGDLSSFEELMDRYQGPLLRYAIATLRDGAAAEDVVQEAFVRLIRQPPDLEPGCAVGPWLFRVCRNLSYDLMKSETRERSRRERAAKPEPQEAETVEATERQELRGLVQMELEKLPPKQREVVRLKVQEGLSYREISEVTGLKSGYIGWLVHTGMNTLTDRLQAAGAL